jgi:hypothetical protein
MDDVPFFPVTTKNELSEHSIIEADANFDIAFTSVTLIALPGEAEEIFPNRFQRFKANCTDTSSPRKMSTIISLEISKSGINCSSLLEEQRECHLFIIYIIQYVIFFS